MVGSSDHALTKLVELDADYPLDEGRRVELDAAGRGDLIKAPVLSRGDDHPEAFAD